MFPQIANSLPNPPAAAKNHTLCIFWPRSLNRKMSSLFRVTIFPHGLCIIWRRNQNHVLPWPAFKPGAAAEKVHAQQVVREYIEDRAPRAFFPPREGLVDQHLLGFLRARLCEAIYRPYPHNKSRRWNYYHRPVL